MDYSIFEPLLALREELRDQAVKGGAEDDKTSIDLLKRVIQQRDRAMAVAERATPVNYIEDILRAASAPLPPLPDEFEVPVAAAAARKPAPRAKTAKAAKTAKKAWKTSKVQK